MSYTTVRAHVEDQDLTITSAPVVASGGDKSTRVWVEFGEAWDGLIKTGVFYRVQGQTYHVLMEGDAVMIPREMLREPGTLYFGLTGTDGTQTKTTQVVSLVVVEGATPYPPEPSPGAYAQILAQLADLEQRVTALEQENE